MNELRNSARKPIKSMTGSCLWSSAWLRAVSLLVLCIPSTALSAGPFIITQIRANPDGYHLLKISGEITDPLCDTTNRVSLRQSSGVGAEYALSVAQTAYVHGMEVDISSDNCVPGGDGATITVPNLTNIKLLPPATSGPFQAVGPKTVVEVSAFSYRVDGLDSLKLDGVSDFQGCGTSSSDGLVKFRIRKSGDTNRIFSVATTAYVTGKTVKVYIDPNDRTESGQCIVQLIQLIE